MGVVTCDDFAACCWEVGCFCDLVTLSATVTAGLLAYKWPVRGAVQGAWCYPERKGVGQVQGRVSQEVWVVTFGRRFACTPADGFEGGPPKVWCCQPSLITVLLACVWQCYRSWQGPMMVYCLNRGCIEAKHILLPSSAHTLLLMMQQGCRVGSCGFRRPLGELSG